jgi:hypothetical protein
MFAAAEDDINWPASSSMPWTSFANEKGSSLRPCCLTISGLWHESEHHRSPRSSTPSVSSAAISMSH